LYYVKPGGTATFNTHCRFGPEEKDDGGGSSNYRDREDVWIINREYKPGRAKNKNELPTKLLKKIILYSSNEGDLVGDLFLGSFSTAKAAIGLGRRAMGFEISPAAFKHGYREVKKIKHGCLLKSLESPSSKTRHNQYKRWTTKERVRLQQRWHELNGCIPTKAEKIAILGDEFGRGYFAILNALSAMDSEPSSKKK
jgi:site-specific DNA-methyltransferase (adenine-specific)